MKRGPIASVEAYTPLNWSGPSELSEDEQEIVEIQRRDLWRHGIRREPQLTEMAFMFAAAICSLRGV